MSLFSAVGAGMAVPVAIATLLEVNQIASRILTLKQWEITFDGVTASNTPVDTQLCIVTATSAVGTAVTPQGMKNFQAAVAATAKKLPATEGTVNIIEEKRIPPTSGELIQYPLGEEPMIVGAASTASGISVRGAAAQAVNATVTEEWEE